ncbi:MAG: hypothetical protein FXF49_00795 [Flexistipes sinusarabici]|uniref:Uncharacterized protein n=1 Tax=Flexistipes sinusarabici TaxID=2352 RepID=A0A5D0MW70_FLESI|nr:hypothetical protein [Flexistipes sinusarabici]TYB36235.1 MAG: hypothetical protein FXF49_00795 [Flexistipes sinusarabici]
MSTKTRHSAQDTLNLSMELRARLDSIQYKNLRRLNDFSSDIMQLWMSDSLVGVNKVTNNLPWKLLPACLVTEILQINN